MRQFHRAISAVFNPLILPTFLAIIIFLLQPIGMYHYPIKLKILLIVQVFLVSFLMPLFIALVQVRLKVAKSIFLDQKEERNLPYIVTILGLIMLFALFFKYNLPFYFSYAILGAAIMVFIAFIINRKWKISAHTMACGGVIGSLLAWSDYFLSPVFIPISILFVISGLVGTSRLYLEKHTLGQVTAGFIVGVLVQLSMPMLKVLTY